jgi:hypothetical protein
LIDSSDASPDANGRVPVLDGLATVGLGRLGLGTTGPGAAGAAAVGADPTGAGAGADVGAAITCRPGGGGAVHVAVVTAAP